MAKKILGKTITMRIDDDLLNDFKRVCGGRTYQDKIRQIMKQYIKEMDKEDTKRVLKDRTINTDFLTK